MDSIKSVQELDAAIRLQRDAKEAALLKRAKSGASVNWAVACAVPAAGLLAGNSPWKAAAVGGLFALIFALVSQAHARVSALVELLELRKDAASPSHRASQ